MPNWKEKMKENHEKHSEEVREVVNFEQEKKYFETNKDMLQNKIVSLQQELVEEKGLEILLDGKDVKKEEELKKIRDFIENNNQQVEGLFLYVSKLCDELKTLVVKNKQKQKELEEDNEEYKNLINSYKARHLAQKIKHVRSTVEDLDHFLVQQGVKGPRKISA